MNWLDDAVARILAFLELGGPVVGVLLCLSVIALAVVLYKAWQFAITKAGVRYRSVDEVSSGALADIKAEAIRLSTVLEVSWVSREQAEDALATFASVQLRSLQSGFRILDSIVQISPLIGLFGTVLGMISAFQALQDAGSAVDPSVLAGGIWVALLTTAVGLAVAMPTSVALSWMESRVERHSLAIQEVVNEILNPAYRPAEANVRGRAAAVDPGFVSHAS
ncbi:MAG: MotA/TolQ/ExbB proton channel family protein [Pseudomonadota bacterium]